MILRYFVGHMYNYLLATLVQTFFVKAQEFKYSRQKYEQAAVQWTKQHAMVDKQVRGSSGLLLKLSAWILGQLPGSLLTHMSAVIFRFPRNFLGPPQKHFSRLTSVCHFSRPHCCFHFCDHCWGCNGFKFLLDCKCTMQLGTSFEIINVKIIKLSVQNCDIMRLDCIFHFLFCCCRKKYIYNAFIW